MKAQKSFKKHDAKADRDDRGRAADDQATAERCPSKTYFRYPAAARRREPVRFYR